jgi:phosphoserine phosphatase
MNVTRRKIILGVLGTAFAPAAVRAQGVDPLASWNDGPSRSRIMAFVQSVTSKSSPDFLPPQDRIAVFDNDGTLWSEQPMYFQLAFIIDRVKALSAAHPDWKDRQPFKGVLEGNMEAVMATGERGLLDMAMATHAGMSSEEFAVIARDWLATARHPKTRRLYTEMVFQPMLELLAYLRGNGFKTYIVSGGGVEFLRVFAEQVYGVPPEQVIGSTIKTRYEQRNGRPAIVRLPEVDFIDDKAGKPVAINKFIGKRPIAAFGNSDGDFEMLEWVTSAPGVRLALLVHHDDGEREWAYDRKSHVGRLDRGLEEGPRRGWTITSMKKEWKSIYPVAR